MLIASLSTIKLHKLHLYYAEDLLGFHSVIPMYVFVRVPDIRIDFLMERHSVSILIFLISRDEYLFSLLKQVSIEVKISAGTPTKQVVVQEAVACNATWVVLDR